MAQVVEAAAFSRKRDKTITMRVSAAEKAKIEEYARAAHLNLTDFVIWSCVYRDQKVMVLDDHALEECRRELSKQGTNLNQIAHAFNILARKRVFDADMADFASDSMLAVSQLYESCLGAYKAVSCLQSSVYDASLKRDLIV